MELAHIWLARFFGDCMKLTLCCAEIYGREVAKSSWSSSDASSRCAHVKIMRNSHSCRCRWERTRRSKKTSNYIKQISCVCGVWRWAAVVVVITRKWEKKVICCELKNSSWELPFNFQPDSIPSTSNFQSHHNQIFSPHTATAAAYTSVLWVGSLSMVKTW